MFVTSLRVLLAQLQQAELWLLGRSAHEPHRCNTFQLIGFDGLLIVPAKYP